MRYYIIDDEIGTIKTLENIVEMRNLGEVIGYDTDPEVGMHNVCAYNPDIVLVDLLMSKLDGIALVEAVKKHRNSINFIMISQVNDKEMVEAAYNAGVEFFINKPINVIEVEKVLKNVADKISMRNIVINIKEMFETTNNPKTTKEDSLKNINFMLGMLGMTGERGTSDIISICQYMMGNNTEYNKNLLLAYAKEKGDSLKNIEQRMRRAIKKGLNNVANIAINDYGSEVLQTYANYVFEYRSIKEEMDLIKHKSHGGGRVNINKFIEGLILYDKSLD